MRRVILPVSTLSEVNIVFPACLVIPRLTKHTTGHRVFPMREDPCRHWGDST